MTNKQIIKAFVSGATKGKNSLGSMFIEGDTLYSYGYHFPLAKRQEGGFWVNPDKYSVTTSKQQGMVRGAIAISGFSFVG
jgi:hypothetical protein